MGISINEGARRGLVYGGGTGLSTCRESSGFQAVVVVVVNICKDDSAMPAVALDACSGDSGRQDVTLNNACLGDSGGQAFALDDACSRDSGRQAVTLDDTCFGRLR